MFVDKGALLPHNHRVPIGSGKIGAVGKVEIGQAIHQKYGKARNNFLSAQKGRPIHSRLRTWTEPAAGDPKLDIERVLHDLSGRCR